MAAAGGAILSRRDPGTLYGFVPDGYEALFAGVLLAGGLLIVWLAHARRRDEIPVAAWKLTAVVGAAALASWLLPRAAAGVWYQAAPSSRLGVEPMDQAGGTSIVRIYAID